ncbi:MAG: LacI family transcriptional regulator [Brevefilum sp.]|nr:LacI family transcriptional regulator [Brevefilum sp.]
MVVHKIDRVTLKDVASIADVSIQTVSRVVNNHPDVAPDTRQRVQEVIAQVGYRPNILARSLISQRSFTLGVVIAGLKLTGPLTVLNGITTAAEKARYALMLMELPSYTTDDIELIFDALLSRQVDGIIWAVPEVEDNRLWINKFPKNQNIPLVYLTMQPQEGLTVVAINNYVGGRLATAHLLGQGYRHIGHIAGPLDWWESRQRMKGWEDTLKEAGCEVSDQHWVMGDWSPASGAEKIQLLLDRYPEMDAIFVGNDQMALGVLHVLHAQGLRVPEDIGLVGFDDIQEAAHYWPPLTTIKQDQRYVGKVAVEELIKLIEANLRGTDMDAPKSFLLDPILMVRESSIRSGNE